MNHIIKAIVIHDNVGLTKTKNKSQFNIRTINK